MTGLEKRLELRPEDAEPVIDTAGFGFVSTDELQPLDEIIGQPRALRALELGLGIRDSGYNVYMSGGNGMGKKEMVKNLLKARIANEDKPGDWIYLNNFDQEDRPLALSLVAGQGIRLKKDMEDLIEHLKDELPRAFRQEDFTKEKQRIGQIYEAKGKKAFDRLEHMASSKGLIIQELPDGRLLMVPRQGDHPMKNEEFEQLSDTDKEVIAHNQQEVGEFAASILNERQEMGRQLRNDVRDVEQSFAARLIGPGIDKIRERFASEQLSKWLERAKTDLVENSNRFREHDVPQQQQQMAAAFGMPPPEDTYAEYMVNVIVDNSETTGAPVIIEDSPNYKNMFGTIHGNFDRSGRLFTNFLQIKAGSLLRANGGYLVFNLMEAILEPLVWKELKRMIKSGSHEYHMYDPFGVFATSSLRPEPIPLRVKLVAVGNPLLYYLLQLHDEDFPEIFKVKADFSFELDRQQDTDLMLARFVRKLRQDEQILPFDSGAISEIVRVGTRMAGDKKRITAELSKLADVVRESSYWARRDNASMVTTHYVRQAVEEKIYRSNLIADKMRSLIADGTLLISLEHEVVGQINGLSIIQLGDYAFGRPSRLTASVGIGGAGIINIERESKLSGSSFDKAMLILEGYLRNKYASKHPIALSASIAMEQSYGMVEGDSASIAELLCILSSFASVPLRQDIAVTGSVNQWGEVQAIGGVTQKIEGFFDVCKITGLTGAQGVCIPAANVKNLVLRPDVVDAMREGRFHIWAVKNVNDAIELFSGMPTGNLDEQDTFHWRVDRRLREMLEIIKEQKAFSSEREYPSYMISPDGSKDPRPRLPGEE